MVLLRSRSINTFFWLIGTIPFLLANTAQAQSGRPPGFNDAADHWADACIQGVGQDGLMKGYLDGQFRPDGTMTRAEFAAVIVKAFPNAPAIREASNFLDVSQDFWGRTAIRTAYERGFLAGYPGNLFRPAQAINRVQAMTIIANTQARADAATDSDEAVLNRFFEDANAIPAYARSAIARATRSSLVVNYPSAKQLRPTDSITRGEATALLCRINADGSDARHYVPADYVAAFGYRFDAMGLPVVARPEPTLLQAFDSALRDLSLQKTVEMDGRLFLINRTSADVWVTDGTRGGTRLVRSLQSTLEDTAPSGSSNDLAVGMEAAKLMGVGDERFWIVTQHGELTPSKRTGLWSSDGTAEGTQEVATFSPSLAEAISQSIVQTAGSPTRVLNGRIPLIVENRTGVELWITDGKSEAGTERLAAIESTPDDYHFLQKVGITDDYLFFIEGGYGSDVTTLWRTDGTLAGTQVVKEISGFETYEPVLPWQNRIYFKAYNSETGSELWTSDGTAAGTALMKDIYPGARSADVRIIGDRGGTLFMLANSSEGLGLWASEGTSESMRLIKLLVAEHRSTNSTLHSSEDGRFLFRAATSASVEGGANLYDIWTSDGTEAGTQIVVRNLGFDLVEAVDWKGQVFFSNRGEDGQELWVSDGTQSGTRQLVDLSPGFINVLNFCPSSGSEDCSKETWWPNDTQPRDFMTTDDFLYFIDRYNRLFRTDGTVRGIELVSVLDDRYDESSNLMLLGETVLFASDRADADSSSGNRSQLFSITNDETPPAFSQYLSPDGLMIEYPADWYVKDAEPDYISIWNQPPSRSSTFPPDFVKTEVWIRLPSFEEITENAYVEGSGRLVSSEFFEMNGREAFRAFIEDGESGEDAVVTVIRYPERTVQIVSSYTSGETSKIETILDVHQSFGFVR